MPSDKYRITNAGRSIRHAANHFFNSFNAGSPYPFVSVSPDMAAVMDDSDLSNVDRRSAHNALERARRENLNIKFQELAHALPSLQTVRRPSKTVIVAKSLEFVSNSIQRENNYMNTILQLRKENERLRKQAVANGQAPPPPCSISPPLTPVQEAKTPPTDMKEDTKSDVSFSQACVDAKPSTAADTSIATTTATVSTPITTTTSDTGVGLMGASLPVGSMPAAQQTPPQSNLTTTPTSYYMDAAPDYEQTFMNYMDPAAMMMNFTPPPAYYASNHFYPPPPPPPPNHHHHHYYQQTPAAANAFPYMSKDPQFFV